MIHQGKSFLWGTKITFLVGTIVLLIGITITRTNRNSGLLHPEIKQFQNNYNDFLIEYNSSIKNIHGRLNRGDIKKQLDSLNTNYLTLNHECNVLKYELYNMKGEDMLIIPNDDDIYIPNKITSPSWQPTPGTNPTKKCHAIITPQVKPKSSEFLRYKDIRKYDRNNKKFKRVYIPQRGWVSMNVFELEESLFGPETEIKSSL